MIAAGDAWGWAMIAALVAAVLAISIWLLVGRHNENPL